MGWLSRTFRPAAENGTEGVEPADAGAPVPTVPTVPTVPDVPVAHVAERETPAEADAVASSATTTDASTPTGRYGPLVSVTRFDTAPAELEWQLPLNGELYRLMPGADRPDYSLLVLERPLHFYPLEGFDLRRVEAEQQVQDGKGRTMVRVHALLLCARYVGQQLHPGMTDLAVNLAYVIDNSLARDPEVDFSKIEFAAIGFLTEGHAPRAAAEPTPEPTPERTPERTPEPSEPADQPTADATAGGRHTTSDVLDELARTLRRGIEDERGAPVQRMTAVLTLDPDHRLTGLSGNADGQAPVPSPDTFGRLAEVLARLDGIDGAERVAAVTLRVDGEVVSHEVTRTHD